MVNIIQTFNGEAVFSEDMLYRYLLTYEWFETKGRVMFIMLNPSTADAQKADPTVNRCINFARAWGFGSVTITNLFALIATNPKKLIAHADPIGESNDFLIGQAAQESSLIVAAWGNITNATRFKNRTNNVIANLGKDLYCLEITKEGEPSHPLYLSGELKPKMFRENEK